MAEFINAIMFLVKLWLAVIAVIAASILLLCVVGRLSQWLGEGPHPEKQEDSPLR